MSNHPIRARAQLKTACQRVATYLREPVRQGWEDMRLGLPFRPGYETMTGTQQRNYEVGRARCLGVKESGMVPVEWRKPARPGVHMLTPQAVDRQINLATALGGIWPGKPLPEDPNLQFGTIHVPLYRARRRAMA